MSAVQFRPEPLSVMNLDKKNILLVVLVVLFIVFIGSFLRQPKIYTFYKEQFVPSDMDTVFEFFSRPENLEKITPSSMGFNIITPSPIEMKEGAIIDYTVKIMGVPMRWRTMITSYKKNEYFVDEQLKGPYSYWHHRHSFKEVEGGVLIIDEITYALPIQAFRKIVHPVLIKPQIEQILISDFKILNINSNNG